ncbi:MAG: hypothetical protein ACR2H3_02760 [Acidimicrobiales bacterium]
MTERTAKIVRALTVAAFAAVVVAGGLFVVRVLDTEPEAKPAEVGDGELNVSRAIDVAQEDRLAVRGFVFDGPGGLGLRLCNGIQKKSPPLCLGPYLDLERIDRESFGLKKARTDDGDVHYPGQPVTLLGVVHGTVMSVEQVLR